MKKHLFLSFCLIFGLRLDGMTQIPTLAGPTPSKESFQPYQVIDLSFSSQKTTKPDAWDLSFGAIFRGPSGESLTIPGFFDGENDYRIRFSHGTTGTWTYITYSSDPDLAGKKGQFTISGGPFFESKGPVQINPVQPQKFQYANGESHFPLAFELDWLFALDYADPKGTPKTDQILDDISKNGFNHVVMNVYAYDVGWKIDTSVPDRYFFGRPNYSPYGGTNENPDFSTLNTQLFENLDRVILALQKRNMDAHLMIYVWNKQVNWPEMYSKEDNRYFDYIIKRYQAFPNIIWDVSKEALDYGRCDIPYLDERISRIRKLDAFDRLITVHDYEYNSRRPDQVDFISIQSWRSQLYNHMIDAVGLHPDKPVFNIEHGGYEKGPFQSFLGTYTDAAVCLERAYETIFGGVYGSYYWQNAAWNIVVYDALDEENSLPAPRYEYYRHLQEIFSEFPFEELEPSYPKITTNSRLEKDNYSNNGMVLTDHQDTWLILLPKEAERTHLNIANPSKLPFRTTWIHPLTGERKVENHPPAENWKWKEVISPWQAQFAILAVELVR
ncbi:DUF5060 domain-containing protein [Algoriphagus sp. oki45]|uniref:DUF5060 domain-containing protein n=1 Tax=Algoriphagus sp. oki45 TaxID=3067294 RepID=UPI0027F1B0C7|nr:DUF5060 domain-containing protein [Algoriphagus sp. oki45]